jgi:lipopolysaccharide transport system ATP-binding protein
MAHAPRGGKDRRAIVSVSAVISVQNVSKRYRLYQRPLDRVLDALSLHTAKPADFWALRNINFRVEKGEVFALMGPNGCGKSTLLQVISGILQPTTGRVLKSGRLAALLELGAGFNPEFTGRENVFLNGEIMGLSRREIEQAFPKIEAFAEIGEFINRPVKEYSTGMYVRLAFSAAIHVDPEILIVDEALSVGDAIFASRCIQKFDELRQRHVTILLVSHDLGLVKRLADRAAFLLNGEIVMQGSPKDAVNRYNGFVLDRQSGQKTLSAPPDGPAAQSSFRHGDRTSTISEVALLNRNGDACAAFQRGDKIVIRVTAAFHQACDQPVVGILIRSRIGMDVFGTNTRIEQMNLGHFQAGETLEVEFELDCLLSRNEYTVTVATQHWSGLSQDWLDDVIEFRVIDTKDIAGVLNLNTRVQHRKTTEHATY